MQRDAPRTRVVSTAPEDGQKPSTRSLDRNSSVPACRFPLGGQSPKSLRWGWQQILQCTEKTGLRTPAERIKWSHLQSLSSQSSHGGITLVIPLRAKRARAQHTACSARGCERVLRLCVESAYGRRSRGKAACRSCVPALRYETLRLRSACRRN